MKRIVSLLVLATALAACRQKVPSGYVGVKVYLLGGSKGVDHEVLGVGRYWIGVNEQLFTFPTFQQNYVWTKSTDKGSPTDESITFQTKEGMTVNTDVGITYGLDPQKVAMIFQKYRRGINEITDTFLRNQVRDTINAVASTMSVEDVYGNGKVKMMEEVNRQVKAAVEEYGMVIEKIYLINEMRLPANVVEALNQKIGATQKAQQRENELREAEAEAKKVVAKAEGDANAARAAAEGRATATLTEANAQAKANQILNDSLTDRLIEYRKIDRWNGALPQFTGGSATPLINFAGK